MERIDIKIKYVGWFKTERSYRTGFSLTPTRGLAAPLENIHYLLPLPTIAITEMHNIIAVLARVATSRQEIKKLVNRAKPSNPIKDKKWPK